MSKNICRLFATEKKYFLFFDLKKKLKTQKDAILHWISLGEEEEREFFRNDELKSKNTKKQDKKQDKKEEKKRGHQ